MRYSGFFETVDALREGYQKLLTAQGKNGGYIIKIDPQLDADLPKITINTAVADPDNPDEKFTLIGQVDLKFGFSNAQEIF